ncbi:unnamed protein product [Tilletia controversa]|uniref:Uncharacterized protein n=2 Tax=Tilletia TaxID=13289 RepID=A0A8X7STW6_9BASI|nr:hypothetical protein CF336_g8749 [Tilletia laevis]KAE8182539.1 hypothetical protein CF328_g8475 [Tilletia controversa]KAE8238620.1 hypothetical protein A4X03_0g8819 [Tilletia caries]KAE8183027.1 hypothetical protein CF335_g8448 [Tilletia laevis]KAE8241023.1 hypothetical protein A4X06_0g7690 [Tilletia controversa]
MSGAPAKLFPNLHVLAAQRASLAHLASFLEKRVDKSVKVITRPKGRTTSITRALESVNDSKLTAALETKTLPSEVMTEIGVPFETLDWSVEHELIPALSRNVSK